MLLTKKKVGGRLIAEYQLNKVVYLGSTPHANYFAYVHSLPP